MPFFAPKGNTGYYTPNVSKNPSPAVTAGTGVGKDEDKDAAKDGAKDGAKDESGSEDQTINVKKKLKKKEDDDEDTETSKNTKLNALLYHTSDDTVDLYKRENNSSDLLGRLYYDDYDSDSAASDGNASPMIGLSPVSSGHNLVADYFAAARFPGSTASINGILSDPTVPHTPTNGAATGQVSTPGGSHTPSFMIGARSPSAGPRVRPAVQRLASFERGISFDNSEDDHRRSLTFKVRHPNFKFRRNNKTFLAGYDGEMESLKSIEWLFDEMIVNGDTIIILQVLDEKLYHTIDKSKAKESLRRLELLNKHVKKVSMVFEIVIGKPQKLLQAAIDEYNPQMMAIGTHNYEDREGKLHEHHSHKTFLSKSSTSKHFLECALIPVIVVKPYYEHFEALKNPIDSENYFSNWISNSDIGWTYSKDKNARKKRLASPLSSRLSSFTNLAAAESRGRGASNLVQNQQFEKLSTSLSAVSAVKDDTPKGEKLVPSVSDNQISRSDSRSRSRSRSRTGLRKLFGHH